MENQQCTHINDLPRDCMFRVFTFLPDPADRYRCSAVSRRWLLLQLQLHPSDLPAFPSQQHSASSNSDSDFSSDPEADDNDLDTLNTLEGAMANDMRIAAVVLSRAYHSFLIEINLVEDFPSNNPFPALHHQVVTDFGLQMISLACPYLEVLSLINCIHVTSAGVVFIAEKCTNLTSLELNSCPLVGDEALLALSQHCGFLSFLTLRSCLLVTERGIAAVLTGVPSFKAKPVLCIELRSEDDGFAQVRSFQYVRETETTELELSSIAEALRIMNFLILEPCSTGKSAFTFILSSPSKTLTEFHSIKITNCDKFSETGLTHLTERARLLEKIKLEKCSGITTQKLLGAFINCGTTLKYLSLLDCTIEEEQEEEEEEDSELQETAAEDHADLFRINEYYAALEGVKVDNCRGSISEAFLSWIGAACRRANTIEMLNMKMFTDECLVALVKSLKGTTRLTNLDLSGCEGITDTGMINAMVILGGRLEWLGLGRCRGLSGRSLGRVGEECRRLKYLDVSECAVSDRVVMKIARAGMVRLKTLKMRGCGGVTDKGLSWLRFLKGSLVDVDVNGCASVSENGVALMRQALALAAAADIA